MLDIFILELNCILIIDYIVCVKLEDDVFLILDVFFLHHIQECAYVMYSRTWERKREQVKLFWHIDIFLFNVIHSNMGSVMYSKQILNLLYGFWHFVFSLDWGFHCETSYAKDGFWTYVTQIATCSPWMFWMFLNSVFHFMWVAVLLMCQMYQVWKSTSFVMLSLGNDIRKSNSSVT